MVGVSNRSCGRYACALQIFGKYLAQRSRGEEKIDTKITNIRCVEVEARVTSSGGGVTSCAIAGVTHSAILTHCDSN